MDASTASDASARSAPTSSDLAEAAAARQVTTPTTGDPAYRKWAEETLGEQGSRELFGETAHVTPSVTRPETVADVDDSLEIPLDDSSAPPLADAPADSPRAAATVAATLADPSVETVVSSVDTSVKPPVEEVQIEGTIGVELDSEKKPAASFGKNVQERRVGTASLGLPVEEVEVKGKIQEIHLDEAEVESKPDGSNFGGVPLDKSEDPSEPINDDDVDVDDDDVGGDDGLSAYSTGSAALIRQLQHEKKVITERLNQEQILRMQAEQCNRLNKELAEKKQAWKFGNLAEKIRARNASETVGAATSPAAALGAVYRVGNAPGQPLPTIVEPAPAASAGVDVDVADVPHDDGLAREALDAVLAHIDGESPDNDHPLVADPSLQKLARDIRAAEAKRDYVGAHDLLGAFQRVMNATYFAPGTTNPPPPQRPSAAAMPSRESGCPPSAQRPSAAAASASDPPSLAHTDSGSIASNGGSDDTYEKNSSYMSSEKPGHVGGVGPGFGVGATVPQATATPVRGPFNPFIPSYSVMSSPMRSGPQRSPFRDSRSFVRAGGMNLSESAASSLLSVSDPEATFLTASPDKRKEMAELIRNGNSSTSGMTFDVKAIISKGERLRVGDTGHRDEQDRLMATPGTTHEWKQSHKFGGWSYESAVLKDKQTINDASEKQVLEGYSENTLRFLKAEQHFKQYDMNQMAKVYRVKEGIDLQMPPEEMVLYDVNELFYTDVENTKSLWSGWATINEAHVSFVQRFYNFHPSVCSEDMESNRLAYAFLGNVMTENLKKEVEHLIEENFSEQSVGTTTLLWLLLNRVLKGSASTEQVLLNRFEKVTTVGPKVLNNGENISSYREYLVNVLINPLVAMDAFSGKVIDPVDMVLEGLSKSSVSAFSSFFEKLHTDYLSTRCSVGGLLRHNFRTTLSSVENGNKCINYLNIAKNKYLFLFGLGKWSVAQASAYLGGRISADQFRAAGGKCFNRDSGCDGNHPLSECPNPVNDAKVKVRRDEYFKERDAKRADRKSTGGGGGNGGGGVPERDPKDDSASTPRQPKTFRIQGKGEDKRVQWKCRECERWCDHPTDLHARAARMGDSFSMPVARPSDPGVKKMKSLGIPAQTCLNSVASAASRSSGLSKAAFQEYEKKKDAIVAQMALQTDKQSPTYLALSASLDRLKSAALQNF